MTRTVALTLILVVLLLGAFSSSAGARDTGQFDTDLSFRALAVLAARPASGQVMYENIHEYMWKPVYVMGTVDYALPQAIDGQLIFVSTWLGEGHRVFPLPGVDFAIDDSPVIYFNDEPIVGDVIIQLAAGMEFPHDDFELVGNVCGVQKFHTSSITGGAAYPIICIANDGQLRIRELPVSIRWLDE